jgi:hypothetical protein
MRKNVRSISSSAHSPFPKQRSRFILPQNQSRDRSGMATGKRYRLIRPKCRFCAREWTPPAYVSANVAYCSECEVDRLDLARERCDGIKLVIGLNGEKRLAPANT